MKWSLRNQIIVTFCGLIIITVAAVSLIDALLSAHRAHRRIERQLASITQALKLSDFPLTEPVLRQLKSYADAEFIVTDPQGQVFSTTFAEIPREFASILQHGTGDGTVVELARERFIHSMTRTQRTDASQARLVHVLFPESLWQEDRWQAEYPHLIVGAIALALGCAICVRLAGSLSEPMQLLQSQVREVAKGKFKHVPPPPFPEELRELSESVNFMVDDLTRMSQAIQRTERLSLIGQLSAGLAHHLRNAIAGAGLAIQVHEKTCRSDDKESLEVAKRQLRLTEEQIRRLLAVKDNEPVEHSSLDLAEIVREVVRLTKPTFEHRIIELRVLGCDDPCPIYGNHAQLHQAILELLLNALDAAGEHGWVEIELRSANNGPTLRVRDSGPGVPADLRSQLFEPFVTGKSEGVGLGLTSARRILEAHQATLQLLAGQPTCFEAIFCGITAVSTRDERIITSS